MLVLAFDTATPAVTVGLHDGRRPLAESTVINPRRHGEALAPSIAAVLDEAGVDRRALTAVVVGCGPGPYTGLRVGVATAHALAVGLGIPAYGVCTLDILAYDSGLAEPFIATTDARRGEVFWARYADARTRVEGPTADRPHAVPSDLPVVGAGPELYPEDFPHAKPPRRPRGSALATLAAERIAGGAELAPAHPIYLRRPDAQLPGPRKLVMPT